MGRKTEYKKKYIKEVDNYLSQCFDEEEDVVKYQSEKSTGYDKKLVVKLPTIEGFALYLGVNKTTLYYWEEQNEDFSNALDKIRTEQQDRLINKGLSGDYNSTIAKLVLSANHGMREKSDVTTDGEKINQYEPEQIQRAAREIADAGAGGKG